MSPSSPRLSLQDLSVGQVFVSNPTSVTVDEIKKFAAQFDPQPFHLDEAAASKSIFGGLVASGWHAASASMRLIVESVPLDCGLVGLGGTLTWLKPLRPNMSFHVESRLADIKPSRTKPGQAVVTLNCMVIDDTGQTLIEFAPKLMVFPSQA
jgi:acyl dehydratase